MSIFRARSITRGGTDHNKKSQTAIKLTGASSVLHLRSPVPGGPLTRKPAMEVLTHLWRWVRHIFSRQISLIRATPIEIDHIPKRVNGRVWLFLPRLALAKMIPNSLNLIEENHL